MASTLIFVSSSLITSSTRHKLCVLDHAVVCLFLLVRSIADKHFATVLPTHVLGKCWQIIKSPVPDITRVTYIPLVLCVLLLHQPLAGVQPQITSIQGKVVLVAHVALVKNFQELPWEPVLDICSSRCRQASVALHVLLEGWTFFPQWLHWVENQGRGHGGRWTGASVGVSPPKGFTTGLVGEGLW